MKEFVRHNHLDRKFMNYSDFWRYEIGVNVIPADTRNKSTETKWAQYQDKPIPEWQHEQWKTSGAFDNGMAVILGKVYHNKQKDGLYLIGIDCDNAKAIEELCTNSNGKTIPLAKLAETVIVEQHLDDTTRAHVLLYSHSPFPKKSSDRTNIHLLNKILDSQIPSIEVKGLGSHGILFVSPSIHENGHQYQIIGTKEPAIVDNFVKHLNNIFTKYSIPYLETVNENDKTLIPIDDLFKEDFTIIEGHNRHEALMRVMESILAKLSPAFPLDKIKDLAKEWNNKHCVPPLDNGEFEKQWKCALHFIGQKRGQHAKKEQRESSITNNTRSAAETLVDLATENIALLFTDQYGSAYAIIQNEDHREVIKIESNKFKRFLSRLYYDKNCGKVINAEAITNAVQVLQAKAEYTGQSFPMHLRLAWHNGDIYYDMTNERWQSIKISKNNWELISHTPDPLFIRYNQIPQANPDRSYAHDIFDRFLELTNLKEDEIGNRILLKVYIVSLFIPEIPHAMLILHGEKGSAKSTLQSLIKLLVDPSKPSLFTIHKDRTEFIQQLGHNYVVFYDNVKNTPDWLSDEACKAITGIGQTKRKLYSDDDDIVYEYKRCLGFNGINLSLTEPDALDRSIMIELERIKKEARRVESEIIADFLKLRPMLLGYIFDILVNTLKIMPTIKLNDLPRMADFALWGEAIARAMGYKELQFINAYYENIGKQNIEAIENHPLGRAITKLYDEEIESIGTWEGTPAELLGRLELVAQNHGINTNHRSWPKEVRWLIRRLNQIRSNLLEGLGIDVRIMRVTTSVKGKVNTSSIVIRKITPMPPMSPISRNHEENIEENTGDILSTGDILTPMTEITPVKCAQNQTQNLEIRDTGDTGVIFQPKRLGDIEKVDGGAITTTSQFVSSTCSYQRNRAIVNNIQYAQAVGRKMRLVPKETMTYEKRDRPVRIEDFFHDDPKLPWQVLPDHSLEESPCYAIIEKEQIKSTGQTYYRCRIHSDVWNIDLRGIENHCKYHDPDKHKTEILKRLNHD